MPSPQHVQLLNLPHMTPIACENCGGKAHLVLLTAEAAMNGHALHHVEIRTFECAACRHVMEYHVED